MAKKTGIRTLKITPEQETIIENAIGRGAKPFPIVGIGASAGGIAAVSALLDFIPADLGMAYVVIQHLSPQRDSILAEVLQARTSMPVNKAVNGMELMTNNVYVIPPDTYMSVVDGHLVLAAMKVPRPHHVVDYFLTALATIYQNNAIAIILSGTGTDGTAGIQAVKTEGGITFAQDETAMFQGMPLNAINSGFVDFIQPPEAMARELASLVKIPYIILPPGKEVSKNDSGLKKIHALLHNKRNVDFSDYKQTTINRRILRRMALNKCSNLQEYVKLLMERDSELELLYRDLLINVTSFFREEQLYRSLSLSVFPSIDKDRKSTDPIRVWIPACSTGEEACTFAICLFEYFGERALTVPIQIFATDLSDRAIEKARTGIYSKSAFDQVPKQTREKYFTRIDGHYQVIKPIRDVCIFATHNLLKDPPFSRMDIISCQNVMIYLESTPQKRILNAFHYALKPTGFLILGKSETIGNATDLFNQADKEFKIYTKKAAATPLHFDLPSRLATTFDEIAPENTKAAAKAETDIDIEKEIDRILLTRYVPASVVINKDLQIIRFHGAMSQYLQPASGKASFHLLKMVRDEVLFELRTLIHKSKKEGRPLKKDGIHLTDGGLTTEIELEVLPIKSLKDLHFLIVFKESTLRQRLQPDERQTKKSKDARILRIQALEQELADGREHMKAVSEEFEATREELQSANEEVLSSNEELQSINEELETSKEELQSSNEELTTINEELQHRNQDLRESVKYTEAIVQTIREPLLVLNTDLRVRTANKAFYATFRLATENVEGQYFYDIGNGQFNIADLKRHLSEVISSNTTFQNVELITPLAIEGERVLMYSAVRMTQEDGRNNRVLLSIEDITQRRKDEAILKSNEERFRLLVQNAFDVLAVFTKEGNIQFLSGSAEHILGYKPEERMGLNVFNDPIVHPDDMKIKQQMFRSAIAQPHANIKAEFRLRHKDGHYIVMEAVCINLLDNPPVRGIVANYRDITQRRMLERQKEEFLGIASHELKTPVTSIKGYTEILIENFEEANDPGSVELVKKLDKQVTRLTDLIRDLLDVTRITEGQLSMQKGLFDINELVAEVAGELQLTTNKQQLVLKQKPVSPIMADKERIRQVLVNLIANAIKYSPNAGRVLITTGTTKQQHIKVSVKDSGIGMSKDMEQKVFDRFYRGRDVNVNTFPGLGLGLFIASEIVKRHNGQIYVKSEIGKGSEFSFVLPV